MNRYDVEAIAKSALPVGGAAKRLKLSLDTEEKPLINHDQQTQCSNSSSSTPTNNINFSSIHQPISTIPCGIPFDAATAALYHQNLFHHFQSNYIGNSDSAVSSSAMATPMTTPMIPQPAEFFLWPHQSY